MPDLNIFVNKSDALEYVKKYRLFPKKLLKTDEQGNTILHHFPELIESMACLKICADIENNNGDIPLMFAAKRRDTIPLPLISVTSSKNISKVYPNGETILTTYLCYTHCLSNVIELLVRSGCDVNQPNKAGFYPLELAMNNNIACRQKIERYQSDYRYAGNVQRLKEELKLFDQTRRLFLLGAKCSDVYSKEGYTFLGDKIKYIMDFIELVRLEKMIETTENSDLFCSDIRGNSPLHVLSTDANKYTQICLWKSILKHVDINAVNNSGETALVAAIKSQKENTEIILSLIDSGADVNISDKNGNTALHCAVCSNTSGAIIVALIRAGADLSIKNNDGLTPYEVVKNASFDFDSTLICRYLELEAENKVLKQERQSLQATPITHHQVQGPVLCERKTNTLV